MAISRADPTYPEAFLIHTCRAILVSTLTSMQIMIADSALSSAPPGAVGQPCYIQCEGACRIHRGPTFATSQVIYDEATGGYLRSIRTLLGLERPNLPAYDTLLQLQVSMQCALGPVEVIR